MGKTISELIKNKIHSYDVDIEILYQFAEAPPLGVKEVEVLDAIDKFCDERAITKKVLSMMSDPRANDNWKLSALGKAVESEREHLLRKKYGKDFKQR